MVFQGKGQKDADVARLEGAGSLRSCGRHVKGLRDARRQPHPGDAGAVQDHVEGSHHDSWQEPLDHEQVFVRALTLC